MGVFQITAYTNSPSDTGKVPGEKGYGITASGLRTVAGVTVSADWSVLPEGTKIQIQGLPGTYTVEDTGSAIQGRHIDLYVNTDTDAINWGVQYRTITVSHWGGTGQ